MRSLFVGVQSFWATRQPSRPLIRAATSTPPPSIRGLRLVSPAPGAVAATGPACGAAPAGEAGAAGAAGGAAPAAATTKEPTMPAASWPGIEQMNLCVPALAGAVMVLHTGGPVGAMTWKLSIEGM